MKKFTQILLLLIFAQTWAQTDFSNSWEDFYSYNNVKDFIKVDDEIFAISDNAFFTYNLLSGETNKKSSINGLSGESTSSICYSKKFNKIIIGYETGLIEIIDKNGNIIVAKDIENFNYSGSKKINDIFEFENKIYIATSFAIVVYDIEKLQFGDTYFIGNQSSEIYINQITVFENKIYAVTENGVYSANISNPNLIDYNNWTHYFSGNFNTIEVFNNQLYAGNNRTLYKIQNNALVSIKVYSQPILDLKASLNFLTVATSKVVYVIDNDNIEQIKYTSVASNPYFFNVNTAFYEDESLLIGTVEFGILKSNKSDLENFQEIHPEGPYSNYPFSISVKNNNLWVVFGSYDQAYTPLGKRFGVSHFNSNNWVNIPYKNLNLNDLVNVTFDPLTDNKVYISSWGGGMLVVENDEVVTHWNHLNSGLEKLVYSNPNYVSIRINGSAFDSQGNLWIANAWVDKRIKKYATDGVWSSFDMSSVITNSAYGLNELIVDNLNTVWVGSRRNGVLVFNENGNRKKALTTEQFKGSLPDLNVRTLQMDKSNRLWIGTLGGLVVLYNANNVFDNNTMNAEPVIFLENGVPKKLLGEEVLNSIAIDGADNKWFGSVTGGALQTNPNGTITLKSFNTDNSPLPSNNILKIAIDNNSGKVYFATDKGIVAYKSNVAAYGDNLPEVYAFPNPSTKNNNVITIDGRNGAHLPNKTNVKILDTAGNLVYETNVKEGQELYGGKVIWNKINLAGKKVASGIYIVLLTANEGLETAITKIAIIN
ncbi:type IX secretion system anionic LPS delivery protein PorZ [Lutibacter maritimus]|uniref:Two component regulator propeller n=1 Tax=Lutibacter maritimus TaxID=593133 RepID=A0A1I6PMA3_9FLAO|nr:two-component regulator propeller domain-containing protein [Lutibacter maritimus]SFS41331.1 Two component regulator propeller [Lutibacter maritimus]